MGRITTIIWMASFAIAAFGLYIVKYAVQDLQQEVEVARSELAKEQESLHLLNAEWAYLNRPERLRSLAEAHLSLEPLDSRKVGDIRALPAAYNALQPAAGGTASTLYQPVATEVR